MKAIVFTDLHLKKETEAVVFDEILPGIVAAAREHSAKDVIFLGDWYTLRYNVNLHLQNRCVEFFRTNGHLQFRLLPGNHDQYNARGRNALEVFGCLSNVKVYSEPEADSWGVWVPYRLDIEEVKRAFAMPRRPAAPSICYLHYGVTGALKNNHIRDADGVNASDVSSFDLVLCGHYHKRQKVNNVTYVGSTYQTRADESGQDKGYAIFEPREQKFTWVTTDWGPRYHRSGLGDLDLNALRPGDDVRLHVPAGTDMQEIASRLQGLGVKHSITVEEERSEVRLDVADTASLPDYATEYAKKFAIEEEVADLLAVLAEVVG